MLLLASLSLYAAYTANIVGLLQSTTNSIRTISDLFNSPLKLGAQDVVYNRHYFKVGVKEIMLFKQNIVNNFLGSFKKSLLNSEPNRRLNDVFFLRKMTVFSRSR